MQETKKSSQVDEPTSEDIEHIKLNDGNHKQCDYCEKVILISDNYCSYCGKPNPKETF